MTPWDDVPMDMAHPHLPIVEDLLPTGRGGTATALRARISRIVHAWLADANDRASRSLPLDRSPLALGPPLLFAAPAIKWHARVAAAERRDWHGLQAVVFPSWHFTAHMTPTLITPLSVCVQCRSLRPATCTDRSLWLGRRDRPVVLGTKSRQLA
jgi:hypothetical protein